MSHCIEWRHDGRRIVLPVVILAPEPSTDLAGVDGTALLDTGPTTISLWAIEMGDEIRVVARRWPGRTWARIGSKLLGNSLARVCALLLPACAPALLAGCTASTYSGISLHPGAADPELQTLAYRAQAGDKHAHFCRISLVQISSLGGIEYGLQST